MTQDTVRRALDLVEDLRADIDFEIDDVITEIIRDLPDDYFRRLRRSDQLKHLRALLAISICQLDNEIMLRSKDDRHVAVIARQDYPGLLAKILERLPSDRPLIKAQIFTSKAHNFIIDLFEFDSASENPDAEAAVADVRAVETSVDQVADSLGVERAKVAEFVSYYPPASPVLTLADEIQEHYQAFVELEVSKNLFVSWRVEPNEPIGKLTVATNQMSAREVFARSAGFLAAQSLDVGKAFLNDLSLGDSKLASIASFSVSSSDSVLDESMIKIEDMLKNFAQSE